MSAKLRPYPAYKDSGVPWLGKVPSHWRRLPGRACYRKKRVPNKGLTETTVLSLSYGHIVVKPPEKLHGLVPASFETYQIVEPGDIIVRPTDLQNDWTSLRFGLSRNRGVITSAYMCLHTEKVVLRPYGHLLLHTYDLKKVFYGMGSGLRQNLDWRDFKYLPCIVPPIPEQTSIARFLDHADRRVRRYIRAKERLIELLEEQKQAIIHQAVTGQIDVRTGQPYPAYKDSGVEWLGEVPEHWKIRRGKTVFRCIDERSETGSEDLLTVSSDRGIVPRDSASVTMFKAQSYVGHKLCWPGDLVINSLWAWSRGLGVSRYHGIVSTAYGVYRVRRKARALPDFIHALVRSEAFNWELRVRSKGIWVSRLQLTDDSFLRAPLLLPPLPEQRAIARFLAAASWRMSAGRAAGEREIELLREYRTRLIADVVTGKLDVREAAARLPGTDPLEGERDRADTIPTDSNLRATAQDMMKEASA